MLLHRWSANVTSRFIFQRTCATAITLITGANEISFHVGIASYRESLRWTSALQLLRGMPKTNAAADLVTFNTLVTCGKVRDWQACVETLATMLMLRLVPNIYSFTAAITASLGAWMVAAQIFSEMLAHDILPDTVSCNALMNVAETSRQWQTVLQLLAYMGTEAAKPNEISFTSAISAGDRSGHWQLAMGLLSHMPRHRVSLSEMSGTAAMSACERAQRWEAVTELLSTIPAADEICSNVAIAAYRDSLRWTAALQLLRGMPKAGVTADLVTFNALVLFWQIASSKLVPDQVSCSSVIVACGVVVSGGKGLEWQMALHFLLEVMPAISLRQNEVSFNAAISVRCLPDCIGANAAISACGKGGQWQLALHLFYSLSSTDVSPDGISCNAAISACEKVGKWIWALWLLAAMPEFRISPDLISFSSAISACEKGLQWQVALLILLSDMGRAMVKQN
ncbi:EMB2654, partial [Symbiodinium sp. KB8]